MPKLGGLLRVVVVFAVAMIAFVAFSRVAWAYPGVKGSDYGFDTTTGCTQPSGCHQGKGADPTTTRINFSSGGGGTFVGSTLYVDPSAILNFTVTISTKAGSAEQEKGINVFTSGYNGTMSTGDAPATATSDGATNNEITFSPSGKTGDSVTYSFSLQAPSTQCTSFTMHAWGNATDPTNATTKVTDNQAGHDAINISSRCGIGTSCSVSSTVCASGQCWDSVCCDRYCGSTCDSCLGAGGVCHPVTSPRAGGCGGSGVCSGFCDGSHDGCSFPTTTCAGGTCAAGVAVNPVSCSGGSCPSTTTSSCAPFTCNATNTACSGSCGSDAECVTGFYCAGGVCVAQNPNGTACTATDQCTSGNCVEGVCCDTTCNGQCASCKVAGAVGKCSAVTGAPIAGKPPCTTDGTTCGGACDGTALASCTYPTTSCRSADCTGGVQTDPASCDGKGTCPIAVTKVCSPYACKGTSCGTTCTADTDCSPGNWCQAGACVPKSTVGASCGDARECTTGNCVDFVCCNTSCNNPCEACDVTGHAGTCSIVSGAPHGSRTCPTDESGCAGTCSGASNACAPGVCDAGSDAVAEGGDATSDAGADATIDAGADGTSETDESGSVDDGSIGGDTMSNVDAPAADTGSDQPNENGGCACRVTTSRSRSNGRDDTRVALGCIAFAGLIVVARRRRRR